jgi:hypothetical protein
LRATAAAESPDIILVSETWLNPEIRNSEIAIEGYSMEAELRRDREDTVNGLGGGLIVYTRTGLSIRKMDKFNNIEFTQFCAFTILTEEPLNVIP